MFSYVFMKILEMRPRSYDRHMDRTSGGRVRAAKEAAANEVPKGSHVLEIGCGTGELAGLMISRGATVEGFDLSPSMIRTAEDRIQTEKLEKQFSVSRMGVDGMDRFPDNQFDAVVSTLVFSELSDDERRFALKHAKRVLKPGGVIIIADEVIPGNLFRKILHAVIRIPILALTYLVSGSSSHPVPDLAGELTDAGFFVQKEIRSHGDSFAMTIGKAEKEEKT